MSEKIKITQHSCGKIVFFETEDWQEEYLKKRLPGHKLVFIKEPLQSSHLAGIKDASILAPFIYSKITKEVIKALPDLKLIATLSTGFDHIDLAAAKKAKVKVANVPVYGANTVAEHTFALILSLSRKIHQSYERTARGNFSLDGLRGFDIKGKTIGIIGAGNIGQNVIKISKGFGMKVLVFDAFKKPALAKRFGFKYVSLDYLMRHSDIISLHAPYNKNTHHLINRKNIKIVKKGVLIINTSRGGLIDTTALIDGLRSEKIAGIGLDVLEEEKYILKEEAELLSPHFKGKSEHDISRYLKKIVEGHMLLISDKVIVTPHNAFNSQEALERILDTTIENIRACCQKKLIKNLVKV